MHPSTSPMNLVTTALLLDILAVEDVRNPAEDNAAQSDEDCHYSNSERCILEPQAQSDEQCNYNCPENDFFFIM